METDDQWNVFVPQRMWKESSGYLLGHVNLDSGLVYIYGISYSHQMLQGVEPVGFWQSSGADNTSISLKTESAACWVCINIKDGKVHCSLYVKSRKGLLEQTPVVCVSFCPEEIIDSYILHRHSGHEGSKSFVATNRHQSLSSTSVSPSSTELEKNTSAEPGRQDFVVTLMRMLKRPHTTVTPSDNVKLFYSVPRKHSRTSSSIVLFLIWIISSFEKILKTSLQTIRMFCAPFPRILQTPSTFQYLQDKVYRYKACARLDRSKNLNNFLLYNSSSQQLVDSCLGVLAVLLVSRYNIHHVAAGLVLDWADGVASQLSDLVQWLMGAPAGLKLNAQLTNFLGHFFIYHIYLWTGYLSFLRSAMPSLLWSCSLVGVLGVSAQICLLQDLLSMLTLHIYCFYVYAAKIFSLQVYMMGSLWRLFRGKKWNVLRSRVDSAVYSTDQLFVGTLLFTVLLFLLPTTVLYYTVFTVLRLAALTVQGCLAMVVDVIMTVPVFTLLLKLIRPRLVAGNVEFTVQPAGLEQQALFLSMQTCQIPLADLIKITQAFFRPVPPQGLTWMELIRCLASGQLIYPWVEPHAATKSQKKMD